MVSESAQKVAAKKLGLNGETHNKQRTHFGRSGPLPGNPLFAPCHREKTPKTDPKIRANCLVFTHTRFQIIKRLRLAFQTGFSTSAFGAITYSECMAKHASHAPTSDPSPSPNSSAHRSPKNRDPFMRIFKEYCPCVERASIDEAFTPASAAVPPATGR